MALVYSYLRFSSKSQAEGDSTRRQVDNGQAWIDKNGHTLANMVLRDMGVSAFRGKNVEIGALGRFLDEVRAGSIKATGWATIESARLAPDGPPTK